MAEEEVFHSDGHYEDLGEEEEADFIIADDGGSDDDNKFDFYVGALENAVMDESFRRLEDEFIRSHCHVFEDSDENKLEYTPIFETYVNLVEETIEKRLSEEIPGFSMEEFLEMLVARKEELEGDIFDTLLACTDFEHFKELMLSYKRGAECEMGVHVSPFVLHEEEEEEGERRPDINLTISSAFGR
uniref:ADP-ribosylation factor-like protein 2-binding protein n=1 Tax=Palpitomonas bilix TaxID=652834 RepID=A0A7S3G294_9EUKA|mmetsp:Transcript_19521/g.49999  ORF Transcript_19521/g.49999 Transcript_19521/m.49999 type:complete len:187 (+) Transcript_19521:248-808(+)|eukprot:CAMPEP_0113875564 /NCGR_PEP_ID=MMETSP0780_2-20120614/5014_1 /TAXON_ID=652834 /ORGANISM="Palpitomonas bilix" /LENGTH=186 /DNA_ID=CAMNT_0000861571 /DNA_START=112 /DNA_END=672 /DNA_ORIENTATION=+ /assembly_acc=CAM_ASM_000599